MRVVLRRRASRGEEPVDEEVAWPKGWPLPDAGMIVIGREVGGWVEHVELNIAEGYVLVVLRPS